MINYLREDSGKLESKNGDSFGESDSIWVDLFSPSAEEKRRVEEKFGIELFTSQESEEIESSSKYAETEDEIGINMNFLKTDGKTYKKEPVSFILKNSRLITQRKSDHKTFSETLKKLRLIKPETGYDVFLTLFETQIDIDADLIESMTERITTVSKKLIRDKNFESDILLQITVMQESTIAVRENIIEKQRILSAMLKSRFLPKDEFETVRIMIKDVNSLLDHTSFNFERLEFLQNTFLGLVDLEQNRIVKIFSVASVIFLPPTLIASIYGMNFRFMPELNQNWGYPFAILLMILSSTITYLFFKIKNWL